MDSVLNSLADTLVRQSWQVLAVFGVVLAACFVLRKASAHWRYLLWLTVIAKCLTPPVLTFDLPILPSGTVKTVVQSTAPVGTLESRPPAEFTQAMAPVPQADSPVTHSPIQEVAQRPQAFPFNVRQSLVFAWIVITGVLLIGLAVRMWAVHRRLVATRRPVDDDTRNAVAALAATLGMKRPPTVGVLDSAAQPFVWGWLRGDIYLPSQFSQTGTAEQRSAILTHELAHVLRWDAAVNHLQNVLQAIFFFHPLVWWTNQKIR